MPPRQYGFTFLELVIVIIIVGVLAAVALPRLGKAQHDARAAKTKAVYGAIRSAAALARSRCELDLAGSPPAAGSTIAHCRATPPSVNMEGTTVAMVNGYPAATASGIDLAAQLNLITDGLTATDSSGGTPTRTYTIEGGNGPDCRITYQEAHLNGSSIVAPVVVPYTADC